jgi:outer membrane protein TolC
MKLVWLAVFLAGISVFPQAQISLTIEQALDIAEENNPQMKSLKLSYERTQYLLEASNAALKPQFSMTVDPFAYSQTRRFDSYNSAWYTGKDLSSNATFRSELPILLTDGVLRLTNTFGWQNSESQRATGTTISKVFMNDLSLRLTQPLFTYNRTKMEFERLRYNNENASISYALQRLRTEQSITRQFYLVYLAQNNLDISLEEFKNAQQSYEIISAQVAANLLAREELYQAEVNLANAESSVELNDVTLKNSKDNLKQTLGLPLTEEINVVANIEVVTMLVDPDKAIQSGLLSRMELRQRELRMAEEDLVMIETKARNEFRGDVTLAIGITGDNQRLGNIYDNPTQSPRVSISFNIPIFDWGQKKARVQAQKTAQTIAKLDYENQKVDIELEIRQTLRNLINLSTQIAIAEKNVRNAELTYELNQIRYREGDLLGLQMSQYQTQLSNAKTSIVRAQINYKNELLTLKILTLYDFENDKPIIPIRELSGLTVR